MAKYLQEAYKNKNTTIYKHPDGDVIIVHHCGSFGEPNDTLEISLDKPDGYFQTSRHMLPEEAVQFGKELIRRARETKKIIKRWKKNGTAGYIPLNPTQIEENPYRDGWFNGNKRAKRFSDLWFSQKTTAGVEQRNKIGFVYISLVLGLGDEVASKFASGDRKAYHEVGMEQAAMHNTVDAQKFWQEIQKIFPDVYAQKDIKFLVECGFDGVWHFLNQIGKSTLEYEQSPILRALNNNAHVYK